MKKSDVDIGRAKAEEVLRENFIGMPPVMITELAQTYGLNVLEANFKDPSVAGVLELKDQRIVVNRQDSEFRQNFTIAHELGHWLMHRDQMSEIEEDVLYRKPIGGETDPFEIQANAFAANLLVPEKDFLRLAHRGDVELSILFRVSQSVIGFRRRSIYGS